MRPWDVIKELESDNSRLKKESIIRRESDAENIEFFNGVGAALDGFRTFGVQKVPVAKADGNVSQSELSKIDQIASALGIRISDFESIKAMFFEDSDSAYKILEISPNVSDSEVKKAYREMAKKYHPDKLQSKDPALIKGAQEKFQEVQKAYETIQNERGL